MRNILTLARKDVGSFFRSWVGVWLAVFFFLITGIFFSFLAVTYSNMSYMAAASAAGDLEGVEMTRFVAGSFLLNLGALLIFLIPLISVRSFAEERKAETLELLYTFPLSDSEIVWGKFLGMMIFICLLALPTLLYLVLFQAVGGRLDWGPVALGYFGFFLLAGSFLSFGLFVSSLTEHQVLSAMVGFGGLLIFWILDWAAGAVGGGWAHLLSALSPLSHYRDFTFGILDLSHMTYFLFFQFYFLFLTLRSVETRNWKG